MTIKINNLNYKIPVYDITVETTHNFYANQILVHNCCEILLSNQSLNSLDDEKGRIATCILSAANLGKIKKLDDFEEICDLMVRGLDSIIDYQTYPVKAAELYTKEQRTLGCGITNFAYYLTKNNVKWDSQEAKDLTHKTFEAFQYYLLKASNNLAKEFGKNPKFESTKYAQGILPIDTYKKDIDKLAEPAYNYDWESLRKDIVNYGLRNNTLSAIMPVESSSIVSNSTNGIEPPRSLVTIKDFPIVVPEISKYKNKYELLWEMPSPRPYLELMGIIQKFVDQSISSNCSYNPMFYENNEVPLKTIISDIFYAYKLGLKTLYYSNTYDMSGIEENNDECESCKV